MRKKITTTILFLCSLVLNAQNLIPNPGFEVYMGKLTSYSNNLSKAQHWIGLNTSDYYNNNEKAKRNQSYKSQLLQLYKPRNGTTYAGIRFQKKYREYIQTKLIKELKAGKKYNIEFYISLAQHSMYQTKSIGIHFSKSEKNANDFGKETEYVQVNIDLVDIETTDWYLIEGEYIAKGNEKYVTIGNFVKNIKKELKFRPDVEINNKTIRKRIKKVREAYYYLDDISITPAIDPSGKKNDDGLYKIDTTQSNDFLSENEILTGNTIIFQNIYFEIDKAKLLPKSYEELNKKKSVKIEIRGHTDNTGSYDNNINLSERRAEAVMDYLINKGIGKNRITYKGFGSSVPIVGNKTEDGRQKNRRVEFVIIQN